MKRYKLERVFEVPHSIHCRGQNEMVENADGEFVKADIGIELLEACKVTLASFDRLDIARNDIAVNVLRAAIAKAEPQQ